MYRDGARFLIRVNIVENQGLNIAVKNDSEELAFAVYDRAPGIAADDVGRTDEIERCGEVEFPFPLFPNGRQFKRFLILMRFGMFECAAERSGPGNFLPRLGVTLGLTKSQSQRESGIRVHAWAIDGEPSVGDFSVCLTLGFIDLLFECLANAPRWRGHEFREVDHWILPSIDRFHG